MKKIFALMFAFLFIPLMSMADRPVHPQGATRTARTDSRPQQAHAKLLSMRVSDQHVNVSDQKTEGSMEVICLSVSAREVQGRDGKSAGLSLSATFQGADGLVLNVPLTKGEEDKYVATKHYFVSLK